jgi:energy-coupling factor transporter ATP-binding protein EcfA2
MQESTQDVSTLIASCSRRVLFLGQSYAAADGEADPLTPAGNEPVAALPLPQWWLTSSLSMEDRARSARRASEVFAVPDRLAAIGLISWSHVVTSAIDDAVRKVIEQPGQLPVHEWFDRGSMTSTVLGIYRLFGSIGRDTYEQWPPSAAAQLPARRTRSNSELQSGMRSWIGPRGLLVIEGWNPVRGDWLRARDLAAVLDSAQLARDQVVVCSANEAVIESLMSDEDFARLIEAQIVRTTPLSLAEIYRASPQLQQQSGERASLLDQEMGEFRVDAPSETLLAPSATCCNVVFSRDSLREYSATLRFLLPRQVSDEETISAATQRVLCHRFLTDGAMSHLEHATRFAFKTPGNWSRLQNDLLAVLRSQSPQDKTVVLRGQSGSGKSTLLARLAVELREAGVPVLIASRGFAAPNRAHIDEIAQRIESAGSRCPCVVFWDGLRPDRDYLELSRYFASRGRKIVVVGTAYESKVTASQQRAHRSRSLALVEIRFVVDLDADAREGLLRHFSPFMPREIESFRSIPLNAITTTSNLFALLFRMFDGIRPHMTSGLLKETETAFEEMLSAAATAAREAVTRGELARALEEALGASFKSPTSLDLSEEEYRRLRDPIYRLVSAVMLSAQVGLPMPADLALRLLGEDSIRIYRCVLSAASFIVEEESEKSIFLRARHRLEAQLWCRKHCPTAEQRFETIQAIAAALTPSEIRDQQSHLEEGHFADFLVRLLQAYGPQGLDEFADRTSYSRIDQVITSLRTRVGESVHPRLLHAQANAIREGIMQEQRGTGDADQGVLRDRLDRLNRADSALSAAFDQVKDSGGDFPSASTRLFLAVLKSEQAAVAGASLKTAGALTELDAAGKQSLDHYESCYEKARKYWRASLALSERNIFAIDIACWVSEDFSERVGIERATELGALTDWGEAIDLYQEAADTPDELAKLDTRDARFHELLGNQDRVTEILLRLSERGTPEAHALRARLLERDPLLMDGPAQALRYLESNCAGELRHNRHILAIYYRVWWRVHTGLDTFFPEDKLVLSLSPDKWRQLRDLADARRDFDPESINQMAAFHGAWASLELDETASAMRVFGMLSQASEGAVRRARSLALLSDGNGRARKLRGEIRSCTPHGRGRAWVPALREELPFNALDFGEINRKIGAPLGPFVVALNYRGAFLQPARE